MTTTQASGWYPDPAGGPSQRWWDGYQWTAATQLLTTTSAAPPGRGLTIAAICCGAGGIVVGLMPILGVFALGLGLVAIILGAIGYRTGRAHGRRQGRAGIVLGVLSIAMGVLGLVIVDNAFDDVTDTGFTNCLARADDLDEIDA